MPPKAKATQKAKESETAALHPQTIHEQTCHRFYQGRPYAQNIQEVGLSGLSAAERTLWATSQHLGASATAAPRRSRLLLSNKAQKELWRHANEASLPLHALRQTPPLPASTTASTSTAVSSLSYPSSSSSSSSVWGRDRSGRDVGTYSLPDYRERNARRIQLTTLQVAHSAFLAKRAQAASKGQPGVSSQDIAQERQRRADIDKLRMELYGQREGGLYAQDPEWDDVEPVPIVEPEGALAAIAYPEVYSDAISYLRAVMAKSEYSPRCLKLTEHIISLNPAHYTVWLYRFSIVNALKLPLADELAWLNEVALQNLKNYQIWHHRFLLAELYYEQMAGSPERIEAFARSEVEFLTTILSEDTKNYHVWSYRQYLVRKLAYWTEEELAATEVFIRQDVRNNSAWSHRFFLVFSDPAYSTETPSRESGQPADDDDGTGGVEASLEKLNIGSDPTVPAVIIEREITYAENRILEAPQNESPWNYLKGVLVKGDRPLSSIELFALQFVEHVGEEDKETVRSTLALDVLAEIYGEKGDVAQAKVYLQRLAAKWDPIRAGYWQYRQQLLAAQEAKS